MRSAPDIMLHGGKVFYSPNQVGKFLGYSGQHVRRLIASGGIKAERHGHVFKVPAAEIRRLGGFIQQDRDEAEERKTIIRRIRELHAEEAALLARLEA